MLFIDGVPTNRVLINVVVTEYVSMMTGDKICYWAAPRQSATLQCARRETYVWECKQGNCFKTVIRLGFYVVCWRMSLIEYIYIYIYIQTHTHTHIYIYIYIYNIKGKVHPRKGHESPEVD